MERGKEAATPPVSRYTVAFMPDAEEDLTALPRKIQEQIGRAIDAKLAVAPDRLGKRLTQSLTGLWRVRSGDYRIAYTLDPEKRAVTIWAIRHRKEIYPKLERRWMRR